MTGDIHDKIISSKASKNQNGSDKGSPNKRIQHQQVQQVSQVPQNFGNNIDLIGSVPGSIPGAIPGSIPGPGTGNGQTVGHGQGTASSSSLINKSTTSSSSNKVIEEIIETEKSRKRLFDTEKRVFITKLFKELKNFYNYAPKDQALVFQPLSGYHRYLIHRVVERGFSERLTSFSIGDDSDRRAVICFKENSLHEELKKQQVKSNSSPTNNGAGTATTDGNSGVTLPLSGGPISSPPGRLTANHMANNGMMLASIREQKSLVSNNSIPQNTNINTNANIHQQNANNMNNMNINSPNEANVQNRLKNLQSSSISHGIPQIDPSSMAASNGYSLPGNYGVGNGPNNSVSRMSQNLNPNQAPNISQNNMNQSSMSQQNTFPPESVIDGWQLPPDDSPIVHLSPKGAYQRPGGSLSNTLQSQPTHQESHNPSLSNMHNPSRSSISNINASNNMNNINLNQNSSGTSLSQKSQTNERNENILCSSSKVSSWAANPNAHVFVPRKESSNTKQSSSVAETNSLPNSHNISQINTHTSSSSSINHNSNSLFFEGG